MDYRSAAKIRKKSFSSLLAEQEGGLLSSIGSTISSKTRANVTGIKETFDPMNIAKKMTFGSNWAPAMMGKMTGRKQSDIAHFTGARPSGVGRFAAVQDGDSENKPVNPIIESVKGIERIIKEREKQIAKWNKEDDKENKRENKVEQKRHEQILKALTLKRVPKKVGRPKKIEEPKKPGEPAKPAEKPAQKQQTDKAAKDKADREAKDKADREAKDKSQKEAKDKADKEAKDAKDKADRESKQAKDKADREAKDARDKADREAKQTKDKADKETATRQKKEEVKKEAEKPKEVKKEPEKVPKKEEVTPSTTSQTASKVATGAAVATTAALAGKESLAANIAKYESTGSSGKSFGGNEYNAYNKGTSGNKIIPADVPIDFSKMTISEYLRRGSLKSGDPDKLFAVGRYQIIPKTMQGLVKNLKIDPNTTTLDPSTQDLLFAKGLTTSVGGRKAVDDYINAKPGATREAAILALAQEFASVGVPYDTKRGDVPIKKGQSYYSGVGGNKAHNSPEEVGAALDADRSKKLNASVTQQQVPTINGTQIDQASQQNTQMRNELNKDTPTPTNVNNTTVNQSNQMPPSGSTRPDDRPAPVKKADKK